MKQRILAYLYDLAEGRDNDFTRALAERLGQPADLKTTGAGGARWDLARL